MCHARHSLYNTLAIHYRFCRFKPEVRLEILIQNVVSNEKMMNINRY